MSAESDQGVDVMYGLKIVLSQIDAAVARRSKVWLIIITLIFYGYNYKSMFKFFA